MNTTTKVGLLAGMMMLAVLTVSGSASAYQVNTVQDSFICVAGATACTCQTIFDGATCHDSASGWRCLLAAGSDPQNMQGVFCQPT